MDVSDRFNVNQRTSSPLKHGRTDLVFSDVDSVSTIPSRPLKDPKAIEEGMIKLKEKILRQKQMSNRSRELENKPSRSSENQVRFLDPQQYSAATSHHSQAQQIAPQSIVRKRKKATAPSLDHYPGCNEAQKPVRKILPIVRVKSPEVVKQPVIRKVKSGEAGSKSTIITTSSWRQGAALTRKVLGNKTQETTTTTSTTSVTSETTSTKSDKKDVTKKEPSKKSVRKVAKPKSPSKVKSPVPVVVRKPRKIKKPVVEEPPKVKARHYDLGDVKQYIEHSRKQRKEQQLAERKKQAEAEAEKEKRLKELDEFRKKALKRCTVNTSPTSPVQKRVESRLDSAKKRISSTESSDKENTDNSVREIPLIPPVEKYVLSYFTVQYIISLVLRF